MGHFFQEMKDHSEVRPGNLEEQFSGNRIGSELKKYGWLAAFQNLSGAITAIYLVLSAILYESSYFIVFVIVLSLCFGLLESVYLPVRFTGH